MTNSIPTTLRLVRELPSLQDVRQVHESKSKLCIVQGLNWDKLRCFSSTGEASSPEDSHWLSAMAGYTPVIEYCGGTEIGGGFLGGTMVQPQAPSHFSTPTIGCRLALLDDQTVLYDSLQGDTTHVLLPGCTKLCYCNRQKHEFVADSTALLYPHKTTFSAFIVFFITVKQILSYKQQLTQYGHP